MKKIVATSIVLATLSAAVQIAVANTESNSTTVNQVQKVADTAPAQHKLEKTWLGVVLAPVPEALSKQLASIIPEKQGVMIRAVSPDSPAAKAGLQDYDILLSFNHADNDQQLFSAQQLAGLVASSKPDDEVTLSVVRNGSKQDIKVKLGGTNVISQRPMASHPMFGGTHRGFLGPQGQSNFWSQPFTQPNVNSLFGRPLFPQGGFPKVPVMPKGKGQANVMQQFESISINSLADDRFRAEVEYQENGGDKKKFTFEGKYDEIRKQITDNKELPESKKNSLLNALKNNPDQLIPDGFMNFPQMPSFNGFFNQQQQAPAWFNNGSKL